MKCWHGKQRIEEFIESAKQKYKKYYKKYHYEIMTEFIEHAVEIIGGLMLYGQNSHHQIVSYQKKYS